MNDDLKPSSGCHSRRRKAPLIKTPDAREEATNAFFFSGQETSNKHKPNCFSLRPSTCSLSFRIFVCVSCSSARSLSLSFCKAKRKNHWQQRLCRRDVCGCRARASFIHLLAIGALVRTPRLRRGGEALILVNSQR